LSGFALATGVRVAVDPSGNPWAVNSEGQISKQVSAGQWTPVPGLSAADIAIGYNGQAWAIGQDHQVYKYDASQRYVLVTTVSSLLIIVVRCDTVWYK
jgi:hypothetical protein